MSQEKSIFDILTDEEDSGNIVLEDEDGNEVEFEQIATIPLDEELYCILRPLNVPEMAEDEAVVFLLEGDDETEMLSVVEDEDTAARVFDEYYKLCDED